MIKKKLFVFVSLQGIMKDKWMNMGYEEEELKPFIEPIADLSDEKRIDTLVNITINVNSLIRL